MNTASPVRHRRRRHSAQRALEQLEPLLLELDLTGDAAERLAQQFRSWRQRADNGGSGTSSTRLAAACLRHLAGCEHPEVRRLLGRLNVAPRSAAQAGASRLNGAHSHGPVTAAGKAGSRLNALKHGLFSKELRIRNLPIASRHEYRALRAGLLEDHQPQTQTELAYVEDLVEALWQAGLLAELRRHALGRVFAPVNPDRDFDLTTCADNLESARTIVHDLEAGRPSSLAAESLTRVVEALRSVCSDGERDPEPGPYAYRVSSSLPEVTAVRQLVTRADDAAALFLRPEQLPEDDRAALLAFCREWHRRAAWRHQRAVRQERGDEERQADYLDRALATFTVGAPQLDLLDHHADQLRRRIDHDVATLRNLAADRKDGL